MMIPVVELLLFLVSCVILVLVLQRLGMIKIDFHPIQPSLRGFSDKSVQIHPYALLLGVPFVPTFISCLGGGFIV